jgi:hypothetical protein
MIDCRGAGFTGLRTYCSEMAASGRFATMASINSQGETALFVDAGSALANVRAKPGCSGNPLESDGVI